MKDAQDWDNYPENLKILVILIQTIAASNDVALTLTLSQRERELLGSVVNLRIAAC